MPAILALLPSVFSLIQMAVPGVENLVTWVQGIRTAAQQSGEWTDQLESDFVASLDTLAKTKPWTPDAKLS